MNDLKTPRILCQAALITAVLLAVTDIGIWAFQTPLLELFRFSEGGNPAETAPLLISPLLRLAVAVVLYLLLMAECRREPSAERRTLPVTAAVAAPVVLSIAQNAVGIIYQLWLSRTAGATALARSSTLSRMMAYLSLANLFIWLSFAAAAGMLYARRNINQSV